MIDTNLYHVIVLAKLLLPKLEARSNSALIINSSAGCVKCVPGMMIYTATKAFLTRWSEGLAIELSKTNVDLQCICINATRTNIIKTQIFDLIASPVSSIATACNKQLGRSKDDIISLGNLYHEILTTVISAFAHAFPRVFNFVMFHAIKLVAKNIKQ